MDESQRASLLQYAASLEERDLALAAVLDELATLMDEVQGLRARAVEVALALERLPVELDAAQTQTRAAEEAVVDATESHIEAEALVARLEVAKRPKQDDLDQAHRELTRANEAVHDAKARRERAQTAVTALHDELSAAQAESEALVVAAWSLAARVRAAPRVADAGKVDPGASVTELDEWGARARAALFVAHSASTTERERVLLEANALGVSVLGDTAGTVSVALVRKHLEESGQD